MPDSVSPQTITLRSRRKRRWLLLIALAVSVIFLFWIGLLARDGLALRADVLALQDYAAALPQPATPADIDMRRLQQQMTSLDDNLTALRSHAGPLLFLTPALGWLPNVGGDVQAAPALLDMALEFTGLGRQATTAMEPFWPFDLMNGRITLPALTRMLQYSATNHDLMAGSSRSGAGRAPTHRRRASVATIAQHARSL